MVTIRGAVGTAVSFHPEREDIPGRTAHLYGAGAAHRISLRLQVGLYRRQDAGRADMELSFVGTA